MAPAVAELRRPDSDPHQDPTPARPRPGPCGPRWHDDPVRDRGQTVTGPRRHHVRAVMALAATWAVVTAAAAGAAAPVAARPLRGATAPATPALAPAWIAARGETARDESERACVGAVDRPLETVADDQSRPWPGGLDLELPDDTVIDVRGRTFDNSFRNDDAFATGVKFHDDGRTRRQLCFVGGSVTSTFDPEDTPWRTWHRVTGMTVLTPGFELVGTHFSNQGDMVAFGGGATDWAVVGVRTDDPGDGSGGYIHDDCVENDSMNSGVIDDVKLDGCMVFLSSLGGSNARPAPGGTVEVRRSLVRLRPYRNSYKPEKYGADQHGGFFKWARGREAGGVAPALVVADSMFRADAAAPYGGNENGGLGLPPGTTCRNVVLVGTASWPASDLASWQDQCTDLVLGTADDWDVATAAWDAAHPPMRDLRDQGRSIVAHLASW